MINWLGFVCAVFAIVCFGIIYKKKRDCLALYVVFMMLFLPKINIFSVSSNTSAGIRTDDLLIFLFMLVVCFVEKFKTCSKLFDSKVFKIFYVYIFCSVISVLIGEISGYCYDSIYSLFSLVRKVEYFCFIFLGYDAVAHSNGNLKERIFNCLKIFTIVTGIISAYQVFYDFGSFRFGEYDRGAFIGRATGTFNGPYEIGAFFVILLAIYFYQILKHKRKDYILYFIISIVIITFSKSRISLLAAAGIIALMLLVFMKKRYRNILIISGCLGVIAMFLMIKFISIPVFSRFKSLNLSSLWNSLEHYIYHASYDEYVSTIRSNINIEKYVLQSGDISFNVRIFKWMAMVEAFFKFPLFGYGFGANSVIDGNYVKMLAENGLIGTFLFILALMAVLYQKRQNEFGKVYSWIIISVFIGSIFIDLFDASKIMEFVWFWIGLSIVNDNNLKVRDLWKIHKKNQLGLLKS